MIPLSLKGQAIKSGIITEKEILYIENHIENVKNEVLQQAIEDIQKNMYDILRKNGIGENRAKKILKEFDTIDF